MQTDEFIAKVEQTATHLNPDVARAGTFATLQALCEHLPAEQARRLSAQLPLGLSAAADDGGARADTGQTPIKLSDFYEKVASKAEISHPEAQGCVPVVVKTLKRAVSGGEIADVALDLPPNLSELLAH